MTHPVRCRLVLAVLTCNYFCKYAQTSVRGYLCTCVRTKGEQCTYCTKYFYYHYYYCTIYLSSNNRHKVGNASAAAKEEKAPGNLSTKEEEREEEESTDPKHLLLDNEDERLIVVRVEVAHLDRGLLLLADALALAVQEFDLHIGIWVGGKTYTWEVAISIHTKKPSKNLLWTGCFFALSLSLTFTLFNKREPKMCDDA